MNSAFRASGARRFAFRGQRVVPCLSQGYGLGVGSSLGFRFGFRTLDFGFRAVLIPEHPGIKSAVLAARPHIAPAKKKAQSVVPFARARPRKNVY